MRFLVDECTGTKVANWLKQQGYEVFSVYEQARGITDNQVLDKAITENWILITNDKDFGEKIYREKCKHRGVIFLRLDDERSANKITVLSQLLSQYEELQIMDCFVVVTETQIRFAKTLH
jgi:predicted nuclease of predicted toxin-antitoxin system